MKLLHIVATPRGDGSNTLPVAHAFLTSLREACPRLSVHQVDLYQHDLPAIAGTNIDVKYTLMLGQPIDPRHADSWREIERLIEEFISADIYLVTTPMWNFSVPYALKYYIDCIVQPGYVYRYDEVGTPVPLVLGKRMVCITSRGGDYGEGSPFRPYDFQEPYLRAIFGFIGITDITFVNAQPMDITPALRQSALERATEEARTLAAEGRWTDLDALADVPVHPPELKPPPLVAD
jgi:FMN-dependent NADH-azoreductase